MKISKFATGLGVALMGVVGAFATAKTYAPNTYYYQAGAASNTCTPTIVDIDCLNTGTGCFGPTGQPSAGKQLFRSITALNTCRTSLRP